MKTIVLYTLLLLPIFSFGQADFIATFKTDNPGTSSNTSIIIPCSSTSGYQVDFNNDGDLSDAGEATVHTTGFTHDFAVAGTYTIRIVGNLDRILFNNSEDPQKLLSVDQWGTASVWTTMDFAFYGCSNLSFTATDAPNLSSCTSMNRIFRDATNFNSPIDHWDVSNITNMSFMFQNASSFNQPLGSWNVTNVTNMSSTFANATNFNQTLNSWNVANVTNMNSMFKDATSFNQTLHSWNVANVTNMANMFYGASNFDQPVDAWNVTSVTNMVQMFRNATSFNQPLISWDISSLSSTGSMFRGAASFNQPLISWDVINVTSMANMFRGAASFNQPLNTWNVSNVTNMSNMFRGAANFNQSLNSWNVVGVTNMANMFEGAASFNQSIDVWNVASVTNMSFMFRNTTNFNQPLNSWNVANVTNMSFMFENANAFNQPLNSWNVSSVTTMRHMFRSAISFNHPIDTWDVSSVTHMGNMFSGASAFNQSLAEWNITNVSAISGMLSNTNLDCANYDATLIDWEALGVTGLSLGAGGLNYDQGLTARTALTTTHGWTITGDTYDDGCSLTLPIELLNFDANLVDNTVQLNWQTTAEINNDYFQIQRSKDGISWEDIAIIKGAGNSTKTIYYQVKDQHPILGTAYYRLQQYDFDGTFSYSNTKAVHFKALEGLIVYPNPTNGLVSITNAGSDELFSYELIDWTGKIISTSTATINGFESTTINLENVVSGVYFIRIFNEHSSITVRIIKK